MNVKTLNGWYKRFFGLDMFAYLSYIMLWLNSFCFTPSLKPISHFVKFLLSTKEYLKTQKGQLIFYLCYQGKIQKRIIWQPAQYNFKNNKIPNNNNPLAILFSLDFFYWLKILQLQSSFFQPLLQFPKYVSKSLQLNSIQNKNKNKTKT